ncbi:MAG TPA: hypothetical protein VEZ11_11805 [Thermoanaerobaculia bacterium]|nr:hypothetical protein [Thermoanaerobaculia bacterium]
MSRAQVIYLNASAGLVALTGFAFAWMKYAMKTSDPFAVANHPLQPYALSAHVFLAPFLVFAFGWIFGDHIWPKFSRQQTRDRRSGLWPMAMIAPMALSGYLIQIATNDRIHVAMNALHWISSALFVVAYTAHLVGGGSNKRASA